MTKGHNVDDIAHDVHRELHHLGLTKGVCEEVTRGVFAAIKQRCATGPEPVNIRNFGAFEAKVFKGRTLNSPLMKDGAVSFPDQLVLRFRQSQTAKAEINEIAAAAQAAQAGRKGGKKKAAEAEAAPEAPKAKGKPAKAAPAPEAPKAKGGKKKAAEAPEPAPEEAEEPSVVLDSEATEEAPAPKAKGGKKGKKA